MGTNPVFDKSFLASHWPNEPNIPFPFHYRTYDLNSVIRYFTLKQGYDFKATRDMLDKIAKEKMLKDLPHLANREYHDALYDAWLNVYRLKEVESVL
jgi:hypothetical protein